MRVLLTPANLLLLSLLLFSCRLDRPAETRESAVVPSPPADDPNDVLRYWLEVENRASDQELLQRSDSLTRAWLSAGAESYDAPPLFRYETIEGMDCRISGDSALCLLAGLSEHRLVLDSVLLTRREGIWILHAFAFHPQSRIQ
jgi:hypothetical protein